MRNGRPKAELVITPTEREHLSAMARSRSLPAALVLRARLVLACEGGLEQPRRRATTRASGNGRQVAPPLY